jgi:hypothetical protein
MRALAFSLLLAAPLLAGCDELDDAIRTGDFRATVTGDVDTTFTGDAYWTVLARDGRRAFVVFLFAGDLTDHDREAYTYVALSRAGDAPGVGVYAVANAEPNPPAFRGQYADLVEADEPEAAGPVLSATDGVFSLTRFQSGIVNGSFRFDAQGLRLPNTATFIAGAVEGTFEARYLDPGVFDGLGIPFGLD